MSQAKSSPLSRLESFEPFILATSRRFTGNSDLREDLAQEMRIRIWKALLEDRDYTDSYLRQACVRRAQDVLKQGRSVDSGKRRDHSEQLDDSTARSHDDEAVDAIDFARRLQHNLIGKARDVADQLARGNQPARIANGFGVSRQAISHRISEIRAAASDLDARLAHRSVAV